MHAQNLIVDQSCNRQTVKAVSEDLPELDAVPALALIIEAVDPIDRGALVVPTQQEEVLWVLNLVGKQKTDSLQRLLSPVDVVSEEKVVRVRWEPTVLEQSQQVVVLTVHIA